MTHKRSVRDLDFSGLKDRPTKVVRPSVSESRLHEVTQRLIKAEKDIQDLKAEVIRLNQICSSLQKTSVSDQPVQPTGLTYFKPSPAIWKQMNNADSGKN